MSPRAPTGTPAPASPPTYYYSSGKRVRLEPAQGLVAFDAGALPTVGLAAEVRATLMKTARPFRGGLVVADVDSVPAAALARLREAQAVQPVYRFRADLVVVLPEVRVEESRHDQLEKLRIWLERAKDTLSASGVGTGRVTLRPLSGRGEDALHIANELHERIGPELAQARFVRLVARPDVRPSQKRD